VHIPEKWTSMSGLSDIDAIKVRKSETSDLRGFPKGISVNA
jgi:hypothetical protein